ncbi:MAG: ECF transporter S component [Clostridiales bacterium]|nr:ECF transporter S component [Clostridiales bacterium]MCM1435490.1 ECF transporter S component [Ruminococcus flavefaciens]
MNSKKIKTMTLAALLAAFACVATMLIQVPTPTKGYVNLGDCIVNISAWLLGPVYGAAAAGIGSAMADVISGYIVYAPATLIIKGLMAAASFFVYRAVSKKVSSVFSRVVAAVTAELIMVAGYGIFEAIMYGSVATALLGVSGNLIQGLMGIVSSVVIYEAVIKRIPKVV